jgi:cysteinyl-tRNA synthetase, unknown class
MIDRRSFALALGGLLISRWAAAEPVAKLGATPRRRLRDIPYTPLEQIPNHRQWMRDIVVELASYGKSRNPGFIVLARNAPELLVKGKREYDWETQRDPDGAASGKYAPIDSIVRPYLNAIDGLLVDGLFYGQEAVDQPTAEGVTHGYLQIAKLLHDAGRRMLTIEYCHGAKARAEAARKTRQAKTISFLDEPGDKRLGRIPGVRPPDENPQPITNLQEARNFLPLLHAERFGSREDWVAALTATNYDVLLLDPFWRTESLSADQVNSLKYKAVGSQRLVLAVLPVGRALDDRFYWKSQWRPGDPKWLIAPDPDAPSRMVVEYWNAEWKDIIGKYMQGLVELGVDGVLLDTVDAYRYFEELMPL